MQINRGILQTLVANSRCHAIYDVDEMGVDKLGEP